MRNSIVSWKYFLAAYEYNINNNSFSSNGDAALKLGEMHLHGIGVNQDLQKAYQYYIHAAKKNNLRAQLSLGKIYENGYSVTINFSTAYMWYRVAYNSHECNIKPTKQELSNMTEDENLVYGFKKDTCNKIVNFINIISPDISESERNKATLLAKRCIASNFSRCENN